MRSRQGGDWGWIPAYAGMTVGVTAGTDSMVDTAPTAGEAIPPELRIVEWQNEWVVESATSSGSPLPTSC